MSTMKSFADLLNTPAENIEPPRSVPMGTWRLRVKSVKFYEPRDEDTPGTVLFTFQPVEAQEDVDATDLEVFGEDIESAVLWHRITLRDRRDSYKLRKLLETIGVELSGRSLKEAAESAEGYEVMAYVDHEADKRDPERIFERLSDFAPAA